LALYKSFTYLLTYLTMLQQDFHTDRAS